ncbi:MAG: type II secretion system protein [Firmicutes bacterium]|nr:type II secretion system protein [Bacillota bacterium]
MAKKNGFTLVELIVVLAIMAAISAIAVPNFANIAEKSKLKTDIQSAKIIDSAKDLYESESNDPLGNTAEDIINNLYAKNYLKQKISPQTKEASWSLKDGIIKLKINTGIESINKNYLSLSEDEKHYVETTTNANTND